MTPSDFVPGVEGPELAALVALGDRLVHSRPVPSPAFRGSLGRAVSRQRPSPSGLHRRIVTSLASGTACLLVATLGVNGMGPLAPQPLGSSTQTASSSVSR